MQKRAICGAVLAGLIMFGPVSAHAITGVLCIKATGKGAVKVRNPVCKASEVQVGSFDTDAPKASFTDTAQCAADAVRVGSVCVDKYEGSVWQTTDAATIASIQNGQIDTLAELSLATQHGATSDDYGAGCPNTGNGCTDFYAVSVPGVAPSGNLTWFQAAAACRNSGKRLATNQEWQMAALGTPDPGTDNGTTDCNVSVGGINPTITGSRSGCVSDTGAFDMVGNVWEFVADWGEEAIGCEQWDSTYGTDNSCWGAGGNYAPWWPGAMYRGGSFFDNTGAGVFAVAVYGPIYSVLDIGFRCAREP